MQCLINHLINLLIHKYFDRWNLNGLEVRTPYYIYYEI